MNTQKTKDWSTTRFTHEKCLAQEIATQTVRHVGAGGMLWHSEVTTFGAPEHRAAFVNGITENGLMVCLEVELMLALPGREQNTTVGIRVGEEIAHGIPHYFRWGFERDKGIIIHPNPKAETAA